MEPPIRSARGLFAPAAIVFGARYEAQFHLFFQFICFHICAHFGEGGRTSAVLPLQKNEKILCAPLAAYNQASVGEFGAVSHRLLRTATRRPGRERKLAFADLARRQLEDGDAGGVALQDRDLVRRKSQVTKLKAKGCTRTREILTLLFYPPEWNGGSLSGKRP